MTLWRLWRNCWAKCSRSFRRAAALSLSFRGAQRRGICSDGRGPEIPRCARDDRKNEGLGMTRPWAALPKLAIPVRNVQKVAPRGMELPGPELPDRMPARAFGRSDQFHRRFL